MSGECRVGIFYPYLCGLGGCSAALPGIQDALSYAESLSASVTWVLGAFKLRFAGELMHVRDKETLVACHVRH